MVQESTIAVEARSQGLRLERAELSYKDDPLESDPSALSSSETDLVARLRSGDSASFKDLVDSYAELLLRIGARLTGSRSDAEDIVQETFEGALKSLDRFEGRSSLKSWLISILYRRSAQLHRKRKRFRFKEPDELRTQPGTNSKAAGKAETVLDIETILESLPAEHKTVVVLREFEGLTYQEIADALEIPPGTVRSRLFRARQALRSEFQEFFDSTPRNNNDKSGGDLP